MIGIADLRQWVIVLGTAVRGRVPPDLVSSGQEPDDKLLDGYLLRAALLSAAGRWARAPLLPAAERAYQDSGHHTMAGFAGQALGLRETSTGPVVSGLGALIDLAFSLAPIALAVVLLLRLSGRRPVPWRTAGAITLAVYLVFVVWGLAAAWLSLKFGVLRTPSTDSVTPWRLVGSAVVMALWIAALALPAVALGRAARIAAPGLRRPFAAGLVAWIAAFACSLAFTLSGAEQAIVGFLVPAVG